MKKLRTPFFCRIAIPFSLILIPMAMSFSQQPSVQYTLGMPRPSTHLFEVELTYRNLPEDLDALDLILPVWRPGRYLVLDFAGGVQGFGASDSRTPLRWLKVEKSLWRIYTGRAKEVTVRYSVYANEFGQRTRGLNDEHAFVDGSAVFMYAERFRSLPLTLRVNPYGNWHVTTGLEGKGKEFSAPDYDTFIDCPLEIGNQKDFSFDVEGVPHVLSIFGDGNWNADTLMRDIAKIVATQKAFWGKFPYKRYVFLLHCTNSGGGGTEHLNSTIMGSRPYIFNNPESYRGFLGLVSHEFFHTWNVKQLRPKGISPYDYTKENYTQELWVAEGTTSYYDERLLMESGFLAPDKFLDNLAGAIRNERLRPGNLQQSVADASFDAWVKYWKGGEQSNNFEADYYDKGAMVSLLLDLEIRHASQNASSLDDVMRTLYQRFPLGGTGYTVEDLRLAAQEAARKPLDEFFEKYVFGTAPLPWEPSLLYAGLTLTAKDTVRKAWTGFTTSDAGDRTRVTRVAAGSPAYEAGLDLGDEIIALEGSRARTNDITDRIAERKAGDAIRLTVFHNDRLKEIKLTLGATPVPNYKLVKVQTPDPQQKSIYEKWMKTGW